MQAYRQEPDCIVIMSAPTWNGCAIISSMKSGSLLLFFCLSTLLAQDAGTIFGTVNDATGAIVVGAKVSLLNIDTNVSQDTQTDAGGEYIFTPVRIGNYTVRVAMAGFATAVRPGLVLSVQQHMR